MTPSEQHRERALNFIFAHRFQMPNVEVDGGARDDLAAEFAAVDAAAYERGRAEQREADAKLCENAVIIEFGKTMSSNEAVRAAHALAAAIRAGSK